MENLFQSSHIWHCLVVKSLVREDNALPRANRPLGEGIIFLGVVVMCDNITTLTPCVECGTLSIAIVDGKWTGDCLYDGLCYACWIKRLETFNLKPDPTSTLDIFPQRVEMKRCIPGSIGSRERVHVYHKDKDDYCEWPPGDYICIGL